MRLQFVHEITRAGALGRDDDETRTIDGRATRARHVVAWQMLGALPGGGRYRRTAATLGRDAAGAAYKCKKGEVAQHRLQIGSRPSVFDQDSRRPRADDEFPSRVCASRARVATPVIYFFSLKTCFARRSLNLSDIAGNGLMRRVSGRQNETDRNPCAALELGTEHFGIDCSAASKQCSTRDEAAGLT